MRRKQFRDMMRAGTLFISKTPGAGSVPKNLTERPKTTKH